MKLNFAWIFFSFLLLTGCPSAENNEKTAVAAGLPPVAEIAAVIGGEKINVIQMLPQGRTPHDFAPRTSTMRDAAKAKILLTTGMPFENKIADFMRQHKRIICDVSLGIERIAFDDGGTHEHKHHDGCSHDDHDPHVWLSPVNALIIAQNIYNQLVSLDPENAIYYKENFETFSEKLKDIDREISAKLAPYKGKTFFVYHPAFGYFAHAYNLKQRAIELNGREASPAQLAQITKEAKEGNIHTIFIQEQFNPGSARALARQIGGIAAPLDPLAADICENFRKMAQALETGFNSEKK
ncbi:MAG: zinc ABC transporter substrate-binding protein [Lentisphaeria bacterium]|nr:zinc ABC transporter substrate-binding protein [Lentisphaeria bacterium]